MFDSFLAFVLKSKFYLKKKKKKRPTKRNEGQMNIEEGSHEGNLLKIHK